MNNWCVALALFVASPIFASGSAPLQEIACINRGVDSAPSDALYTLVYPLGITRDGRVSYAARWSGTVSGPGGGVWQGKPGAVVPFLQSGMPAPGLSEGSTFTSLVDLSSGWPACSLAANGLITASMRASESGAGSVEGLWAGLPGDAALVARRERYLPTAGVPGMVFRFLDSACGSDGTVAFYAALNSLSFPFGAAEGIWGRRDGVLREFIRISSYIPRMEPHETVGLLSVPRVDSTGRVLVWAALRPYDGTPTSRGAIVLNDRSGNHTLYLKGDPAPGVVGSVLDGFYPDELDFDDAGRMGFVGDYEVPGDPDSVGWGAWFGPVESPQLVARSGLQPPGEAEGVTWTSIDGLRIGPSGHLCVEASIQGFGISSDENEGLWFGDSKSLRFVAREGTPAPGFAEGSVYRELVPSFDMAINANGVMCYVAAVNGAGVPLNPPNGTRGSGLWVVRGDQAPELLLRANTAIDLGDGDQRTIRGIGFSSMEHKLRISDEGVVAITLAFTDNSIGFFTLQIPNCLADTNADGRVDAADLSVLLAHFGMPSVGAGEADFNFDGRCDAGDLSVLLGRFGATCQEAN